MNYNSQKDQTKILNAGFTILRIREVQDGPSKRGWSVWAKTKDKDWHKSSSVYTVKKVLQEYLNELLLDSHTILEG